MKQLILFLIVMFNSGIALSQNITLEWANTYGDFARCYEMTIDGEGNVYSMGLFMDSVDFDPGVGTHYLGDNGSLSYFIMKNNPEGELVWAKSLKSSISLNISSIDVDSLGNVYSSGRFQGTVDFDTGLGQYFLSTTVNEVFTHKLDQNGDFVWVKQTESYGNSFNGVITINSKVDSDLNVYTAGLFKDSIDFDPGLPNFILDGDSLGSGFIQKLDLNGDFIWAKNFSVNQPDPLNLNHDWFYFTNMDIDLNGSLYLTGSLKGNIDFYIGSDTLNINSNDDQNTLILKLDSNGNVSWVKQFEVNPSVHYINLLVDEIGEVYFQCFALDSIDLNPDPVDDYVLFGESNASIFIVKLNTNGEFLWTKKIAGYTGSDLTLDEDHNLYIIGLYNGITDFDLGVGVDTLPHISGVNNGFIQKLNSFGEYMWVKPISGEQHINLEKIKVDISDNIFIGGFSKLDFDLDPSIFEYNHSAGYSHDAFIVKLSECSMPTPVVDTLPDVIEYCAIFFPDIPTASNDCDTIISATTLTSFPIIDTGTVQVVWEFDDGFGNHFNQVQNFTVYNDTIKPVPTLSQLPDIIDNCSVNSILSPLALDNCSGLILGVYSSFPIDSFGTTVVNWLFEDANGNITYQNQNVIILPDTTEPILNQNNLPDIVAECEILFEDLLPPTATDDCSGIITGETNLIFPIMDDSINEVVWTFDDGNGNITTQSQNISWSAINSDISFNGSELVASNSNGSYRWMICENDYLPLIGAVNQNYLVVVNGSYALEITENGCVDTSECMLINSLTNQNNFEMDEIIIHPNPTNGIFQIQLKENMDIKSVEVYSITGATIYKENELNENISVNINVPDGIYILKLSFDDGIYYKEIVIKN